MTPSYCSGCGGLFYHEPTCELVREELVIQAWNALQYAYAGAPLYVICPCQLGYPGVLGCIHGALTSRHARLDEAGSGFGDFQGI